MSDNASFLAYFPNIQSAIKVHGQGDGMRVQLEIPENQMGAAIEMLAWRSKTLRVTIEPVEVEHVSGSREIKF